MVGAFVDTDGDTEYQAGEHATYLGLENIDPTPIVLAENKTIDVDTLVIKGPIIARPEIEIRNTIAKGTKNIGRVVSLDDPMFSRKNASMGFWRPFDFSAQYGGGLMMLRDLKKVKHRLSLFMVYQAPALNLIKLLIHWTMKNSNRGFCIIQAE